MLFLRCFSRIYRKRGNTDKILEPLNFTNRAKVALNSAVLGLCCYSAYASYSLVRDGCSRYKVIQVAECHVPDHKERASAESISKSCADESSDTKNLESYELTPEAEARIKHEISMYDIVLFMKGNASKPQCKYSKHALDILKASRAPTIRTVNVLEEPALRSGIKRFSNYPYIPQLYIRQEFIGGVDKIVALYEEGQLQKLCRL